MDYICYMSSFCSYNRANNEIATEGISDIGKGIANILRNIGRLFLNIGKIIKNALSRILSKFKNRNSAKKPSKMNSAPADAPMLEAPTSYEDLRNKAEIAKKRAAEYQQTANELLDEVNRLRSIIRYKNQLIDEERDKREKEVNDLNWKLHKSQYDAKKWQKLADKYNSMIAANKDISVDHIDELAKELVKLIKYGFEDAEHTFKKLSQALSDPDVLNSEGIIYQYELGQNRNDKKRIADAMHEFITARKAYVFDNAQIIQIDQSLMNTLRDAIDKCNECSALAVKVADRWEKEAFAAMHKNDASVDDTKYTEGIFRDRNRQAGIMLKDMQNYTAMLNGALTSLTSLYANIYK